MYLSSELGLLPIPMFISGLIEGIIFFDPSLRSQDPIILLVSQIA
jgi:hypothetical protein